MSKSLKPLLKNSVLFLFVIVIIVILAVAGLIQYDKLPDYVIKYTPDILLDIIMDDPPPEKCWLHRVNSVEKQKEFAGKYQGYEFDIVFYPKEGAFENSHEKTGNLQRYNFADQLSTYKKYNYGKGIWLDLKNLTEENKINVKITLDGLLEKYKIDKNLIWLESPNWKALDCFKQAGYHTSFYLRYHDISKMSSQEKTAAQTKTIQAARSGNIDAISFSSSGEEDYYYRFLKELQIPPNIVFLTWQDNNYYKKLLLQKRGKKLLNDDRVKIILVKDKGHFNR